MGKSRHKLSPHGEKSSRQPPVFTNTKFWTMRAIGIWQDRQQNASKVRGREYLSTMEFLFGESGSGNFSGRFI